MSRVRSVVGSRLGSLALLLGCATPLPALAQAPAPGSTVALAAESSFLEGVRLMKQGDFQQAAQRFQESQRLDPASGTLLDLAYCQAQLGRTATAWLTYRQAIALAERTGKPAHAQLAREQGEKLEPALPKLRLALTGDARRVSSLELDGETLARESWGLALPVDPGAHHLRAVLDDGKQWDSDVAVAPGQEARVEIPLPEAEPSAPKPAPALAPRPTAARDSARPPAPGVPTARSSSWALGLGLAGAGALAAGTALFISARVGYDAARDHCSAGNVCADPYYEREQSAQSRARLSLVVGGVGAALVGAAVVLHLSATPGGAAREQLHAALLGPRDFRAVYTRTF